VKGFKHQKIHFFSRSRYRRILGFLILLILIVALPFFYLFFTQKQQAIHQATPTSGPVSSSTPGPVSPTVKRVEIAILDNIKQNGFNPQASGLWVNWRYGTDPLQTNINGSGIAKGPGGGHDPLTDIRYLHSLWLYASQNPKDTRYESEIAKYTPIVKAEFAGTTDQRGWLFDEEFLDLYNLSHDTFYRDTAIGMAAGYAKAIDPSVGIFYKKNDLHSQGYYRPSDDLEAACALIQAGTLFNHPDWVQQGQTMLNFLYAHAYIPTYHTFADQMDQVLTPSGTVNPSEVFYGGTFRNYTVRGNIMRMGGTSQMIISLLNTYQVTHNQDFLTKAEDLLAPLSLPENSLGMWDSSNLGYFASVVFSGTTPQQPGSITVAKGKKEAGRQILMLWAFHLANQFTHNKYQEMEKQMLTVALSKAYYAPGHGVVYEIRSDWTLLTFPNHTPENAVTTEAMGIELEGLFSLQNKGF
jgi:hypothetical protein